METHRGANYLLGLLVLILAGLLIFWTGRFLQPTHLPPVSPGSYHFIGTLEDIAPGTALSFELEGRPWLLIRRGGEVAGVSGLCTYRGSRIRWETRHQLFLCEGHGCVFDPGGNPLQGLATSPLENLKIRIVGDRIYGARDLS